MFNIILIVVMSVSVCAAVLFWLVRKKRERIKSSVVDELIKMINGSALSGIELDRLAMQAELNAKDVKEVAIRTYRFFYRRGFDNNAIKERLDEIGSNLRLTSQERDDAQSPIQMQKYAEAWTKVAGSELPSRNDLKSLLAFQREIAISRHQVAPLFGVQAKGNTEAMRGPAIAGIFGLCGQTIYRSAHRRRLEGSQEIDDDYLRDMQAALGFDEATGRQEEKKETIDYFSSKCEAVRRTGSANNSDRDRLLRLIKQLGLTEADVGEPWRRLKGDILSNNYRSYRAAYRRFIRGEPSVNRAFLLNAITELELDEGTVRIEEKKVAIEHVVSECESAMRMDSVNRTEFNRLRRLLRRLGLTPADVSAHWKKLEYFVYLQDLRDGKFPSLSVSIVLRPREVCHYREICKFSWTKSNGQSRREAGELFVTNQRLVFLTSGSGKTFEVKLSSIIDFNSRWNGIELRSTGRGAGKYQVRDGKALETLLAALLRTKALSTQRNRGIPTFVKQQVWARDDGRCVLCGSTEDIHFDHDVPFSKGGSCSVKNIRLLCARCNLQKRDRIE